MKVLHLLAALAWSHLCRLSSAQSFRGERQSRSNKRDERIAEPSEEQSRDIKREERIIGGFEAPEDRHSYAVALRDSLGLFCGGSLIAKDVVLTAAHCKGPPFSVVIGRHDIRDEDGEVIGIKRQLPHPNYRAIATDNDFMLVFLKRPASADNAQLVKLNFSNSVPQTGKAVTVMGWGDTDVSHNVELSDVLMKAQVNVIANDQCDASSGRLNGMFDTYQGRITSNMICAKANRRDSCQGDSGAPLVIQRGNGDLQVGIVSWGVGCASPNFPGVYARVSRAYFWIEREVCKGSQYAKQAGFRCSNSNNTPDPASGGRGSDCSSMKKWVCKNSNLCQWKMGECIRH